MPSLEMNIYIHYRVRCEEIASGRKNQFNQTFWIIVAFLEEMVLLITGRDFFHRDIITGTTAV
jgi:hypothetical protein